MGRLRFFLNLLVCIWSRYLPDSADTISSWFDVDYFFVKQLEVLKRGNTNFGTHKHLAINQATLTHKRFNVNRRDPCNSYAFEPLLVDSYLIKWL